MDDEEVATEEEPVLRLALPGEAPVAEEATPTPAAAPVLGIPSTEPEEPLLRLELPGETLVTEAAAPAVTAPTPIEIVEIPDSLPLVLPLHFSEEQIAPVAEVADVEPVTDTAAAEPEPAAQVAESVPVTEEAQVAETPVAEPEPVPEAVAGKAVPAKRAQKKVSRNDPCPCGSGKKHKKCCGK